MKFIFPSSVPPIKVAENDWQSWSWQVRHSPKNMEALKPWLSLTESEQTAFNKSSEVFTFRVTPYYLSLIDRDDPQDPIRKIALPKMDEFDPGVQSFFDPLGERKNNPTSRIIHRYPDRVLFLVTDFCSVYCRYCTRKHFTGQEQVFPKVDEYQAALDYIKNHPGICEVILSGGDPLTLANSQIERVLSDLRAIEHIEIIRIGSRMPVVCPMRIDLELVKILQKHKPVYLMTHFNHPREITFEVTQALDRLADHGVPMFNQMVLLNGVNNHPAIVQALSRRLLFLRVKPYYMFQCDPSQGTDHLRTPIETGETILRELWGNLSGLALPTFSLDIPNGGGKTSLVPNFELTHYGKKGRRYRGWDGIECDYLNPKDLTQSEPSDAKRYIAEWDQIKHAKTNYLNQN